ncbi:AaceriAFL150Cp [[Ashbya] aceris (nom. inval.)]|nr:AaceriAFL150Cp [[Ashbya] aceris (nom. inval.)]
MTVQMDSPTKEKSTYVEKYLQSLGSAEKSGTGSRTLLQASPAKMNSTPLKDEATVKKTSEKPLGKRTGFFQGGTKAKGGLSNNPFLLQDSEVKLDPQSGTTDKGGAAKGIARKPQHVAAKAKAENSDESQPHESQRGAASRGVSPTAEKKVDTSGMSRETLRYYEFLCRVGEAKRWVEDVIGETIPGELELAAGNSMRDGYFLAKVTQTIKPDLAPTIVPPGRLQFKHTQNINAFFSLMDLVGVPDLFRFELTDLYEKKDVPKVFETLHAVANILNSRFPGEIPEIHNLSGVLEFSPQELKECKQKLPNVRNFRSFKADGASNASSDKLPRNEGLIKDWNPRSRELEPALVLGSKGHVADEEEELIAEATPEPEPELEPEPEPEPEPKPEPKQQPTLKPQGQPGPPEVIVVNDVSPKLPERSVPTLEAQRVPDLLHMDHTSMANGFPRTPERQLNGSYLYSQRYISPQYPERSFMGSRTASILLSDPLLRTANTNLTYSPSKNFSYYSPSISRRISYRTDSMKSLDREHLLYNHYLSNYPPYSPARRQRMSEDQFLDIVFRIQALSRGANLRYGIYLKKKTFELFDEELSIFQAWCRGGSLRKRYSLKLRPALSAETEAQIFALQSYISGYIYRSHLDILQLKCLKNDLNIRRFQNIVKSVLLRRASQESLAKISLCRVPLTNFQSYVRGAKLRIDFDYMYSKLRRVHYEVIHFQARCRGLNVKTRYNYEIQYSSIHRGLLEECQATLRGISQRRKLYDTLFEIDFYDLALDHFSAIIKGGKVRQQLEAVNQYRDSTDPLTYLQARVRGVLARFAIELINDVVELHSINRFQAILLGGNLRSEILAKRRYYNNNVRAVTQIQSAIRAYQMSSAYHELLNSTTPSLWAVRKFVHILNENETDTLYSQLHKKKALVNDCNGEICRLQSKIRTLITKKSLLENRGIQVSRYLSQAGLKSLERFSVERASKDVMQQNSLYERICYLLQVDSFYWKLLFKLEPHSCINFLPKLFSPTSGKISHRENLLFIKMIMDLMLDELDETPTDSFLSSRNSKSPWRLLLAEYLPRHKNADTVYLFGTILESLSEPGIDFESVPANIWKSLHPGEPMVASHIAIDDPLTNAKYVENMMNIWNTTESVRNILTVMIDSIPMEIKYLCTKAFRAVADRSTDLYDPLRAIAMVLIEHFVNGFFTNRASYGYQDDIEELEDKVQVLCSALSTIFNLRQFNGYYSSLTPYAEAIKPDVVLLLKSMLISPDFENECDSIVYRDMGSTDRPFMVMKQEYLENMIKTFISHQSIFPHDDAIVELLKQMEKIFETSVTKMSGVVEVELDPTVYHVPLEDDRSALLYNETKRGISYLIQVEDVETNLTDLLTSSVFPEDDNVFSQLLLRYPAIREDLAKKNLDNTGYVTFKKHVMQRVKELKHLGIIDGANNYQSVLNDIANTIRSRSYVGHMNERELIFMNDVYEHLKQKENYLNLLSQALSTAVSKSVKQIQKCGHYQPLKKSGLGNKIKDAYRRVQGKHSDTPNGIHYTWTARQFYERGVLCDIKGENLKDIEVTFFGSNVPRFPDIRFRIATQNGEIYNVDMFIGKKRNMKYRETIKFTELLDKESEDPESTIVLMRGRSATFKIAALIDLLCEVFFR